MNIYNAVTHVLECVIFLTGVLLPVEVCTEVTDHYQEACPDHVVLRLGGGRGRQVTWTGGVLPGDGCKAFLYLVATLL